MTCHLKLSHYDGYGALVYGALLADGKCFSCLACSVIESLKDDMIVFFFFLLLHGITQHEITEKTKKIIV